MIFIASSILNICKDNDVKFVTVNDKTVSAKVVCKNKVILSKIVLKLQVRQKKERKELNHIMIKTILGDPNKAWLQKMEDVETILKIEEIAKY